jgi:hypothetical protein
VDSVSAVVAYGGSHTQAVRADLVSDSEPISQRGRRGEPQIAQIGDVGFVSQDDGAFHRMFNARMPSDHLWNTGGVPENFEPIALDEDEIYDLPEFLRKGAYGYASHVDKRLEAQCEVCAASWFLS